MGAHGPKGNELTRRNHLGGVAFDQRGEHVGFSARQPGETILQLAPAAAERDELIA